MTRHDSPRSSRARLLVLPTALLLAAGCGSDGLEFTVGDGAVEVEVEVDGSVSGSAGDRKLLDVETVIDGVAHLPDGWFEMSGYGVVLHVDGDEVVMHHVTSSTCVVGGDVENEFPVDHLGLDAGGGVVILDLVGPTTDFRLVPLAGGLDCESDADESLTALDEVVAAHYPFLDERGIDWSDALATIRATAETDPAGFEGVLAAFMLELADGHTTLPDLSIDPELDRFGMEEVSTIGAAASALQAELDSTLARVEGLQTDPSGTVGWGTLDDSVGYLLLPGFEGVGGGDDDPAADREQLVEVLDVAIADLAERADRMVVDVRFNEGGYEDLAVLAAGYFVDDPTPAYRKWAHADPDPFVQVVDVEPQTTGFDGEVVVLTSPITASAAEVFALAMIEVADAAVVGNRSFGEFSDAFDWVLPNGIEFTLSMQVYTDLDGTIHEAVGVPVDVEVPFDESLEAAIAHLDESHPHRPEA